MSFIIIVVKTPFSNSLLIFLHCKSINKTSYIRTNIFISSSSIINVFIEVR
jgi:hypothetical protein